jgi:hypothetical protein
MFHPPLPVWKHSPGQLKKIYIYIKDAMRYGSPMPSNPTRGKGQIRARRKSELGTRRIWRKARGCLRIRKGRSAPLLSCGAFSVVVFSKYDYANSATSEKYQRFELFPSFSPASPSFMDESNFSPACGSNSFYITLQEQNERNTPRWAVSDVHTTHVHFAVQQGQHWAAVQLSITPFTVEDFPHQTFHSKSFLYLLCCHLPQATDFISSVVQRIYDTRFQLSQWNCSLWYVFESPLLSLTHS